jgi:predicted nucleic acid-binding protein
VTILVDSSALYALLDQQDGNHAAAEAAFGDLLDGRDRLVSHNYVVTETCALVQRRLGAAAAVDFIQRFVPLLDVIWIDQETHQAAAVRFVAAPSRSTSLVDLVSFEVMRRQGIEAAFAFDRDFQSTGLRTIP